MVAISLQRFLRKYCLFRFFWEDFFFLVYLVDNLFKNLLVVIFLQKFLVNIFSSDFLWMVILFQVYLVQNFYLRISLRRFAVESDFFLTFLLVEISFSGPRCLQKNSRPNKF